MKKRIPIIMTVGLLSGALLHANDAASQKSNDQAQQEQSSIQSESAGAEAGQKIQFNQLPEPVQKTLRAHAGDLNLENIHKQTKNGQTSYQATFDKDDMKGKLTVAEDGSLLQYQLAEDLAMVAAVPEVKEGGEQLSSLPDAVQKTFKEQAGLAEVGNISKSSENGKTVYHAAFNEGGVHTDLFVDETGKLLAQSQETALYVAPLESSGKVALNSAPEAVQKTIREQAGSAQVADLDKGKWNGQTAYRVMIEKNGKPMPMIVSENGDILGGQISEAAGAEKKKDQEQNEEKSHEQKSQDNNQELNDQK